MAWRGVSSFVSRELGLPPSGAAITHSTCEAQFEGEPRPMPSYRPNFRRPDIEVVAFN
jgi:hypothetical protein